MPKHANFVLDDRTIWPVDGVQIDVRLAILPGWLRRIRLGDPIGLGDHQGKLQSAHRGFILDGFDIYPLALTG